jgi:hypothetical protein
MHQHSVLSVLSVLSLLSLLAHSGHSQSSSSTPPAECLPPTPTAQIAPVAGRSLDPEKPTSYSYSTLLAAWALKQVLS